MRKLGNIIQFTVRLLALPLLEKSLTQRRDADPNFRHAEASAAISTPGIRYPTLGVAAQLHVEECDWFQRRCSERYKSIRRCIWWVVRRWPSKTGDTSWGRRLNCERISLISFYNCDIQRSDEGDYFMHREKYSKVRKPLVIYQRYQKLIR